MRFGLSGDLAANGAAFLSISRDAQFILGKINTVTMVQGCAGSIRLAILVFDGGTGTRSGVL